MYISQLTCILLYKIVYKLQKQTSINQTYSEYVKTCQRADLKFSAVFGATSANSSIFILPAGCPPMEISKNTIGFSDISNTIYKSKDVKKKKRKEMGSNQQEQECILSYCRSRKNCQLCHKSYHLLSHRILTIAARNSHRNLNSD